MKIIHTGDLHLYSRLDSHLDKKKASARRDELLSAFVKLVNYAKENEIKVIIIAGDMFDVEKIDIKNTNAVMSVILNNPDIDFIYGKGNHDDENFLSELEKKPSNLKLFSDKWTSFQYGDVTISGIDFTSKTELYLYDTLNLDKEKKNIVVMHGEVTTTTSDGKIRLKRLMDKNIDYLCLGHIHQNSVNRLDERGIYAYCGCLEGRGFDEDGDKGFYVIDTDDIANPKFVVNSIRKVHKIEVPVDNLLSYLDYEEKVKEAIKDIPENDIVEIIMTGRYSETFIKSEESLKALLEERFYISKVKDVSSLFIDPMSFANDKSIKGEFIKNVLNDTSLSEEEKNKVIELGIHALLKEDL